MTTTETTNYALTAHDLRALRHADAICFDRTSEGQGQLRAILRAEHSPTGYEQTHTIPTNTQLTYYKGNDLGTRQPQRWDGFHHEGSAKYAPVIQTLVQRVLRVGDILTLRWTANNTSSWMRERDVTRDDLELMIMRTRKSSPPDVLTFNIATLVCEIDNKVARMVRAI